MNFLLPVLVWVHLLGGHDLEVDLLVEVVGVEEGVAGGAHRLREGGAVVAVADVAHRVVGGQEGGGHLRVRIDTRFGMARARSGSFRLILSWDAGHVRALVPDWNNLTAVDLTCEIAARDGLDFEHAPPPPRLLAPTGAMTEAS